jgi:hypothetical protein
LHNAIIPAEDEMAPLKTYGDLVRRYRGRCVVPLRSGPFEGDFECVQLHDGRIYLEVSIGILLGKTISLDGPGGGLEPVGPITGKTSRGLAFEAEAFLMTSADMRVSTEEPRVVVDFALRLARVGDTTPAPRYRYGVTNLLFAPTGYVQRGDKGQSVMMFKDDRDNAYLAWPRRDTKLQTRLMRAQHSCRVTCEIEVNDQDEELATVGALLSFANGTVVNWIWRDYMRRGKKVGSLLADRVTRPYSGLPMLPTNVPGVVPEFVSQTSPHFRAHQSEYRLNAIVRLLATARAGFYSDLEARGVTLAIVLEVLAGCHASRRNLTTRIQAKTYKAGQKAWTTALRSALLEAYGSPRLIESMLMSARSSMNRSDFREVLTDMVRVFGVPDTEGKTVGQEVKEIVKSRNNLIHNGRFTANESNLQIIEFLAMLSFVDRLLLRLLGYTGPYQTYADGEFRTVVLA